MLYQHYELTLQPVKVLVEGNRWRTIRERSWGNDDFERAPYQGD
jgi:hypothetical protein